MVGVEEVHSLNVYPESELDKPHEEHNPQTEEYEKIQYIGLLHWEEKRF